MKTLSLILPTLQSPQREKYILPSKLFRCLPSYIVWLKSSYGEANGESGMMGVSRSSQEKLNLSQLPFLLSSPSKKYVCVEILNCSSVVLALVNVPPAARTVTFRRHAALARRQTAATAGSGSRISNVSVKACGSVGPPLPKTAQRFARRPTPR